MRPGPCDAGVDEGVEHLPLRLAQPRHDGDGQMGEQLAPTPALHTPRHLATEAVLRLPGDPDPLPAGVLPEPRDPAGDLLGALGGRCVVLSRVCRPVLGPVLRDVLRRVGCREREDHGDLLTVDRDEITIVGRLAGPETAAGASDAEQAAAQAGRIKAFREDTRDARIGIAREIEHRTGRKVAWGAVSGERRELFTHLAVPVMTRLRQPQRQVLDTLVDAGVARSRADALAWCVKLVGENTDSWLADLRSAMEQVEKVRAEGPRPS